MTQCANAKRDSSVVTLPAVFVWRSVAKERNQQRLVSKLTKHRIDVHVTGSELEWLSAQVLAHRVQMEPSMTKFTKSANRGVKRECQSTLKTASAMGAKFCCHTDSSVTLCIFLKRCPPYKVVGEGTALTDITCVDTGTEKVKLHPGKIPSYLLFLYDLYIYI